MGRALLVMDSDFNRRRAVEWIGKAPIGTRVEFKASKRTLPQNDLLWALLTEVSQQLELGGKKYDPSQWKAIFLHAFGREVSFLPSLDQKTFLPIELSSSDLSKDEMTDFIEFILKESAERGVAFRDPRQSNTNTDETAPASSVDAGMTPADEAGADSPSDAPASELFPADRADLIECCRKLMFIVVDPMLETPQQRRDTLVTAKDIAKRQLPEELHPHIAGFFESAYAQIKADPKVMPALREKAFAHFSKVLDCLPSDLGGVDG